MTVLIGYLVGSNLGVFAAICIWLLWDDDYSTKERDKW